MSLTAKAPRVCRCDVDLELGAVLGPVPVHGDVDRAVVHLRKVEIEIVGTFPDPQDCKSRSSDRNDRFGKFAGPLQILAEEIANDLDRLFQADLAGVIHSRATLS